MDVYGEQCDGHPKSGEGDCDVGRLEPGVHVLEQIWQQVVPGHGEQVPRGSEDSRQRHRCHRQDGYDCGEDRHIATTYDLSEGADGVLDGMTV